MELNFLLIIIFDLFDGARNRLTKKRKTNQTADLSLLNNIEKYQRHWKYRGIMILSMADFRIFDIEILKSANIENHILTIICRNYFFYNFQLNWVRTTTNNLLSIIYFSSMIIIIKILRFIWNPTYKIKSSIKSTFE